MAPKEVKEYLYRTIFHRIKKHNSWDNSAEGLDYRMEEKNKSIKQTLQSDNPTLDDWKRAASNTVKMEEILQNARKDYTFVRDATEPYAPKYREKIDYCRSKMRELESLDYDDKRPLANLDEVLLHKDTLSFEKAARDLKKKYLKNVVDSESFVNAAVPEYEFKMLQ